MLKNINKTYKTSSIIPSFLVISFPVLANIKNAKSEIIINEELIINEEKGA